MTNKGIKTGGRAYVWRAAFAAARAHGGVAA